MAFESPLDAADALWGFIVPAIAAAATLFLLRRLLPIDLAGRYPAAVALTVGFLAGYALLGLAPWQPSSHWHWLPYAALAAAVVAPVALAEGVRSFERGLLCALAALAISWLLVPTWEVLELARGGWIIALTVAITLLAALLEPLVRRIPGPLLAGVLSLCVIVGAAILALSGNLRFAQFAGVAAGALLGSAISSPRRPELGSLRGLAFPYAVLSVGLLYVGLANSFSGLSLTCYLLPPLAPLALWGCCLGPLAGLGGIKRVILGGMLVALPLAIAVGLAVTAGNG